MSAQSRRLLAAACAGASTGCRSFTALAALALATPVGAERQPDAVLDNPAAKGAVALLAGGELVGDKLPKTPARTQIPGFGSRVVGAAGSGAIIARRSAPEPIGALPGSAEASEFSTSPDDTDDPRVLVLSVATAVAAAVGAAYLGVALRARAATLFGRDWVGALVEDGATVALATAAVRLTR